MKYRNEITQKKWNTQMLKVIRRTEEDAADGIKSIIHFKKDFVDCSPLFSVTPNQP
jgi:hypothetical protein